MLGWILCAEIKEIPMERVPNFLGRPTEKYRVLAQIDGDF